MGENPRAREARQENNPTGTPTGPAEPVEGRGVAEGNLDQDSMSRMQGRTDVPHALERVRQAAMRDKELRFTALLHHVYSLETLREAYFALKRDAAPGIDGVTWAGYGEGLEENLQALSERLRRGAYRAIPGRRAYLPKADGKLRPLGVIALEDKLVQRATTQVLNAIYESDLLGFSYGFRPGRGQHDALDALYVGQWTRRVNWVLDADIRGFFDAIDREWLMRFIEHRVADRRIHRLIQKWLKAGVLEDGVVRQAERGTVQGGSVSPLLANIYLHYVLDLWAQQWRSRYAKGDVIIVRYADDFIVGFQHKDEAERFLAELRERFAKFGLELHPEKTRLIEFGPWATKNRAAKGLGKPETFEFLGFTHICHKTRSGGRFTVLRQTIRKRLAAKLSEVKEGLKRRMHEPISRTGAWLEAVVRGHFAYYGVPMNTQALFRFRSEVIRLWRRALTCRGQKGYISWAWMSRMANRFLPAVAVTHPYPLERLGVWTRGKSPVR